MQSSPASRCHHIHANGVRCGSLSLVGRRYCYFHQRSRPVFVNFTNTNQNPSLISIPLFEDAHGIQSTLHSVVFRLLDNRINCKTASLVLYALQIASSNLKHMKSETPAPDEVVTDIKLSETPSPEPGEQTARMNSHSLRRTHFPYTPTAKDEFYDDVMRQQRELREHPEDHGDALFSPDLPPNLKDATMKLEGDYFLQTREEERLARQAEMMKNLLRKDKTPENKPPAQPSLGNKPAGNESSGNKPKESSANDKPSTERPSKLPAGTIHGCEEKDLLDTGTSCADD